MQKTQCVNADVQEPSKALDERAIEREKVEEIVQTNEGKREVIGRLIDNIKKGAGKSDRKLGIIDVTEHQETKND